MRIGKLKLALTCVAIGVISTVTYVVALRRMTVCLELLKLGLLCCQSLLHKNRACQ